jgi:hypothetical protein
MDYTAELLIHLVHFLQLLVGWRVVAAIGVGVVVVEVEVSFGFVGFD